MSSEGQSNAICRLKVIWGSSEAPAWRVRPLGGQFWILLGSPCDHRAVRVSSSLVHFRAHFSIYGCETAIFTSSLYIYICIFAQICAHENPRPYPGADPPETPRAHGLGPYGETYQHRIEKHVETITISMIIIKIHLKVIRTYFWKSSGCTLEVI